MKSTTSARLILTACCCLVFHPAARLEAAEPKSAADWSANLAALPRLSWRETGASLALLAGERIVWQFNHLREGSEGGALFHPLATREGAVLTDLRPASHPWHRGLRFAWNEINGLDGYWTWPEGLERFLLPAGAGRRSLVYRCRGTRAERAGLPAFLRAAGWETPLLQAHGPTRASRSAFFSFFFPIWPRIFPVRSRATPRGRSSDWFK